MPTGCRRLAQQAQLQLGLPSRPRTPDTCFHSITRTVQAVPHARDWFLGVVNLRGGVSGVVDLGAFVKHAPPSHRSDLAQSQCRLVAFSDALNINCVVLIDKLLGLKSVESFVASNPPAADAPEFFGHSYVDSQGAAWQEINLQALSLNPQFLSISA